MSFSKIIGQNMPVSLLKADLESGRVADSYLFVGPHGVGRKSTALEFAKVLNCHKISDESWVMSNELRKPTTHDPRLTTVFSDPCDDCPSCRKVNSGNHPDVFVLDFESQSQLLELKEDEKIRQKDFQIEAIRILMSRSHVSPLVGRKKVFIIDGAEHLNGPSANALLKVLEESSSQCHWILLSVSSERVIPTIRSRCRKISFAPLSAEAVELILGKTIKEGSEERKMIKRVAEICDGSVSVALSLLEDESLDLEDVADRFFEHPEEAAQKPFELSSKIIAESRKGNTKKKADEFLKILSLKFAVLLRKNPHPKIAEKLSLVLRAQDELRRNASPQLVLDVLLLSLQP